MGCVAVVSRWLNCYRAGRLFSFEKFLFSGDQFPVSAVTRVRRMQSYSSFKAGCSRKRQRTNVGNTAIAVSNDEIVKQEKRLATEMIMSTAMQTELDQAKIEQFTGKMVGVLNGGALALMTSIGHRTGLFDVMAEMPFSTSQQIADEANLDERYVREWLGAMVTGEIVEYQPKTKMYRLPPEHASILTRQSPANFGVTMQFVAVMGEVESQIVERFKSGGGVGYECYCRFHSVMAEESSQTVVAALEAHILPLAPGLTERLNEGIRVLDVGCGSGRAMCAMAQAFPNSRFVGYDLCSETIEAGRAEAERQGLTNVAFEQRDVANLGDDKSFELVCAFDAIHDQAAPDKVLSEIHRVLTDDGIFLMQDIAGSSHLENNEDHPIAPFMYTISCMHCMSVSLAQGGAGLGAMWGKELACQMLKTAGFDSTQVEQLEHDIINYYYISSKS